MKPLLAGALALAALPLLAQTSSTTSSTTTTTTTPPPPAGAPPAPGGGMGGYASVIQQATATLTPGEKTELQTAREKAMAANPALQTEEMDLMQKVMAMQSGDASDVDRQALGQEMRAHGDKVRAAMIKADPGVQAIIDKVEAQVEKLKAEMRAAH